MESRFSIIRENILLLAGTLVLLALYVISLDNYLLFHSFAEAFSLIVTSAIFMFSWNARRYLDNNYLLFIGIAFLFVACIDLLHMLAYQGMGVFSGYGTNLPTQLWVAGRLMQSLTLFIAPFFLGKKFKSQYVFITYAIITGLLLGSIFYWGVFPVSYVEGIGLTFFKRFSEYVIALIYLGATILLYQKKEEFAPNVFRLLMGSMITAIIAELFFSSYVSVYSHANLIGHIFRIISFYLIYKAVIQTGLIKPYDILLRKFKQNQDVLWQHTVELRSRNDELDAFAHTVAHDLKNPLATIIITAQVLKDPELPERDRQEFLRDLTGTAHEMNNIIDELLLLSETREADVPVNGLDMGAIIAKAQQRLGDMIRTSHCQLTTPNRWPIGMGYAPWVEEVWVNYLSNGIKYGGSPPALELGATPLGDGKVRFWVRDNGQGLTPEQQSQLFKPFTQLSQVRATGHGLGLSIVQRIVDKLGGEVGVESEVGNGSVLFFILTGVELQKGEAEIREPALQVAHSSHSS
jgi:signal transduction histidine kinase